MAYSEVMNIMDKDGNSYPVRDETARKGLEKKQDALTFDSVPTADSGNPVTSGGIKTALDQKEDKLTVDAAPIESSANPVKSGGVYAALKGKADSFTVDQSPSSGSNNPISSGGVYTALAEKQDKLTFDSTPTVSSTNPVTSGGVKTALDQKQDKVTFDSAPTAGSSNPVTSGGVKTAIDNAKYTLPAASAETLGGVKVGSGLTITDGVLSASSSGGGGVEAPVQNYQLCKESPRGGILGSWPVGESTESITGKSPTDSNRTYEYAVPSDSVIATLYDNGDLVFTGSGKMIVLEEDSELTEGDPLEKYGAYVWDDEDDSTTAYGIQCQPWYYLRDKIKHIRFGRNITPTELTYMFSNCTALEEIPHIPKTVTSLEETFANCIGLKGHQSLMAGSCKLTGTFHDCFGMDTLDVYADEITDTNDLVFNATGLQKLRIFVTKGTSLYQIYCNKLANPARNGNGADCYIELDGGVMEDALGGAFTTKNIEIVCHGDLTNTTNLLYKNAELLSFKLTCEGTLNAQKMTNTLKKCESITVNAPKVSSMSSAFLSDTGLKTLDISAVTSCPDISNAFNGCSALTGTITINFAPTTYTNAFSGAATDTDASLVVNYGAAAASVIDKIIATKSSGSHITKGVQV